ncbi:hypothetical protein BUALT_Bualt07G0062200 [Buddleja alternifolia]|uniref:ZF-HD dimerization-type domain-containing protein n=1 Tax=Buddleja alternifolia TaxID=168488 RepID=A0AAV6XGN1_9LAMI|nr:hypothetical protein BUALT_Bualt07G0062200 [Buddleja alternifolia]
MKKRQIVIRKEGYQRSSSSPIVRTIRYVECQKNHAANIGGYAVDGCREFMAGGEDGTAAALSCAACGCHRNFHRREVENEIKEDAAFKDGSCCISVVVHDVNRSKLFLATKLAFAVDAKDAELLAIHFAGCWLENFPFDNICFESDCLGAVEEINNPEDASNWLYEVLALDIGKIFGFKPS